MGGAIWVRKSGAGCYGNRLLSQGAVARVTVTGRKRKKKDGGRRRCDFSLQTRAWSLAFQLLPVCPISLGSSFSPSSPGLPSLGSGHIPGRAEEVGSASE